MSDETIGGSPVLTYETPAGRPLVPALLRGLRCVCPNCGQGKLFQGYLKSV